VDVSELISGPQARILVRRSRSTIKRLAKAHPEIIHSRRDGCGYLLFYADKVQALLPPPPPKRPRRPRRRKAVETAHAAE
jgi:hypothetical protein